MRRLTHFVLTAGVGLACAGGAAAQTTTGTTGTTTGTTGTSTGTGQTGSSTPQSGFSQAQTDAAPTISESAVSGASGVNSANAFSQYYANPQFQGKAGSDGTGNPGGFGTPLYGTTAANTNRGGATNTGAGATRGGAGVSGTTRNTNTAGITSSGQTGFGTTGTTGAGMNRAGGTGLGGTTGARGGLGGTTGLGTTGRGGLGGTGNQSGGELIPSQAQIAYTATLRFPVAPVAAPPQMQADLRGVIDRSSMIANPRGIEVSVGAGNVVVLRGRVRDEDEAKTAEGVIRLTPGVYQVRNELTYQTP